MKTVLSACGDKARVNYVRVGCFDSKRIIEKRRGKGGGICKGRKMRSNNKSSSEVCISVEGRKNSLKERPNDESLV